MKPKDKRKTRRAAAPYFQIASIPDGPGKQRILVECEQDCDKAELRIFVDENVDATCDRQLPSQVAPLIFSNVSINGKPATKSELIDGEGGVVGIDLGNVTADSAIVVETNYTIPEGVMCIMPGHNPTLRIEIASRMEVRQTSLVEESEPGENSGA